MILLLSGGEVYAPEALGKKDILAVASEIERIGDVDRNALEKIGIRQEFLDCSGCVVIPGIVDPHVHLIGGSGEEGCFSSQTPEIFLSELIQGGTTTVVGTLGVDTTTKTMPQLIAKTKALKQMGISAFCYSGGYDVPPKSLFPSVREDIIFVDEVIGAGEIAISDYRAVQPEISQLARVVTDTYIGGILTGKAGVMHVHAGDGSGRLKPLHRLLDEFDVPAQAIYVTHVERSTALVDDGIALAKRGSFIDFDVHDGDLYEWYSYYREHGGPFERLSASSDAGGHSTTMLHRQLQDCVLNHKQKLEDVLPLFSTNAARALKFDRKGKLAVEKDADFLVLDKTTLEIRHVVALGKVMMRDGRLLRREQFLESFKRKVVLDANAKS